LNGHAHLDIEPNALRVLVSKVRKALGEGPQRPSISAEINVGYRMRPPTA
jgi:DNA-binding response OmpR family regulator